MGNVSSDLAVLGLAVSLDLVLGEIPARFHPTVWMGKTVALADRILFTPDMRMDCWLRPGDLNLKYPMPEVDMVLNGRIHRKGIERPMSYMMFGKFKTVRIDLEKAKQLGLVPASEPEDDFESERSEEAARVTVA